MKHELYWKGEVILKSNFFKTGDFILYDWKELDGKKLTIKVEGKEGYGGYVTVLGYEENGLIYALHHSKPEQHGNLKLGDKYMIVEDGGIIFSHNSRFLTDEETYDSEIDENLSTEFKIEKFWTDEINEYNDIEEVKEFAKENIKHLLSVIEKLKDENMILNNELWLIKDSNDNEVPEGEW